MVCALIFFLHAGGRAAVLAKVGALLLLVVASVVHEVGLLRRFMAAPASRHKTEGRPCS